MHKVLLKSISDVVPLTSEEQEIIKKYFVPKRLKKRQFLYQEGNVCDRYTYVSKGSLVTYSTDERGNQHVISFALEGYWVADLVSLYNREPSSLNTEALEHCELLQLKAGQQEELFKLVPAYERYTRIKYTDTCVELQKRIESSLGLTADEKYNRLIKQFPVLTAKIPLNLIASYLGVTPETLSRIRKQRYAFS